ncbi:MAG: hypothetical protein IPO91_18855 [Chloroflexi bacterium]|nr:hypothetical protein [Chloroflexota bacterium]
MQMIPTLKVDLRERAEKRLGKPLASSPNASLWRCPVCPPEAHSLLLVAADQHRCMGRRACDGGINEWMNAEDPEVEVTAIGEVA